VSKKQPFLISQFVLGSGFLCLTLLFRYHTEYVGSTIMCGVAVILLANVLRKLL